MVYHVVLLAVLFCRAASAALVLAHFMVSNTYSYSQTEWKADIASAQQIGIDGFALNWAPPDCSPTYNTDWQVSRINDAFTVAAAMNFKLIYSFDMGYTNSGCSSQNPPGIGWNQTFMASMISKYASNSAMYRWNGNILVSTYAGEGYGNTFFQGLKSTLAGTCSCSIILAPALTTYSMNAQTQTPSTVASGMLNDFPTADGFLNWQAWPLNSPANLTANVDVAFKSAFKNAGRSGPYIMAVSPWQFKDMNEANSNSNSWVEYSDTLFDYRFRDAINTVKPDIIEILTWNDYAESHYIRDLPPTSGPASLQLNAQGNYVYGMDHSAWRIIAQYYISWYKSGQPPAITKDRVVFWYRTHPKAATCSGGANASPAVRNSNYPADAVFAWALVSAPSTISMSVGSNQYWSFSASQSGPVLNMVPFPSNLGNGVYPMVGIMRNGVTVQAGNGSVPITQACSWENFNAVVALAGPGL